jgi:hypothetical protein
MSSIKNFDPSEGIEITKSSYNNKKAVVRVLLNYPHGNLEREFKLKKIEESWKIEDVEITNANWIYVDTYNNAKFEYNKSFTPETSTMGDTALLLKDSGNDLQVFFVVTKGNLPKQLDDQLNCDDQTTKCSQKTINKNEFQHMVVRNDTATQKMEAYKLEKNGKTYLLLGLFGNEATPDSSEKFAEILDTLEIQ